MRGRKIRIIKPDTNPYFDVQAVDVGSCKHAFKDINVEAIPSLPVALAGQSEEVISPKQFSKKKTYGLDSGQPFVQHT